jgi:hypothetical protein
VRISFGTGIAVSTQSVPVAEVDEVVGEIELVGHPVLIILKELAW